MSRLAPAFRPFLVLLSDGLSFSTHQQPPSSSIILHCSRFVRRPTTLDIVARVSSVQGNRRFLWIASSPFAEVSDHYRASTDITRHPHLISRTQHFRSLLRSRRLYQRPTSFTHRQACFLTCFFFFDTFIIFFALINNGS